MVLDGVAPPHILVLGPSGTGKTATVSRVTGDLREMIHSKGVKAKIGYTVAKNSEFRTLKSLAESMGLDPPRVSYGSMDDMEDFVSSMDETMLVIIDEIDSLIKTGKYSKLLHFLTRNSNITLVGISNRQNLISIVKDKKIQSSWNPRKLLFEKYTANQLSDIIRKRAVKAFNEGVVPDNVISFISAKSARMGGDARYALDLLMYSGDIAERQGKSVVEEKDVYEGEMEAERNFTRNCIKKMPIYHKVLLMVVAVNNYIQPSKAYKISNQVMKSIGKSGKTPRRWSDFRSELEYAGFVTCDVSGKGRGKGWEYNLIFPEENDRATVLNVLLNDFSGVVEDAKALARSVNQNNGNSI